MGSVSRTRLLKNIMQCTLNMSMPYKEVLQTLSQMSSKDINDITAVINKLIELIHREVAVNNEFNLPNLGKFVKYTSKPRKCKIPATGETVELGARMVRNVITLDPELDLHLSLISSIRFEINMNHTWT